MVNNKGSEVYFELEKDPLELSQVVVTGTRTSHFVKDVPIRTEVLTSQAITKKNAQNLYEALEGVPGIRVEQQCQFCNFSEVRMQGLGAEHTQVLIDGEPIYSGLAGVYGLQQIGTNDIDRLEVVKGAGSALYSSSAVAGAINIISKEPTFEPFAKNDKLVLRGKAIDEHRFGGVMTNDQYMNPYTDGTEDIRTNRLSADLAYTLPIGKHSELNLTTAYVYHKRLATNDTFLHDYMDSHKDPAHPDEDGAEPDVSIMRPYIAKENTVTPSLTFTSILGNHTLLGGVQGYFTRLRETGLYVISAEDEKTSPYYGVPYTSIGKKHANELGFFVQDEWNVTPKLTVVPGIRIDSHSSGEEYTTSVKVSDSAFPTTKFSKTTVNPRIAIKYELTPSLVLRANVGTGFRAPYGFSEDLHLCSGSPRVWKSSNLKGERAISYNLSADYYAKKYQFSINYNSEDDGATSKIKKTNTFMIFNCRAAKRFGSCTVYAGAKNIFSYIQDEKQTDDAAFMYAPVYGATWYVGLSVRL